MDFETLNEKFYSLEKENNLNQLKILNDPIWLRIKNGIYNDLRNDSKSSHSTSKLYLMKSLGQMLLNLIYKNPFLSRSRNYVFFSSGRRELEDDIYIQKYADPVIEILGEDNCLLIERPFGDKSKHFTPSKTKNLRYMDFIEYGASLLFKLGYRVDISGEEYKIGKIEEEIAEEFGEDLELKGITQYRLTRKKILVPLYRIILRKIDPNIVFVYPYNHFEVVEAAEKENIPTVELQHGTIHQYHPDYCSSAGKFDFPYLADHLWVWGDYWEKENLFRKDVTSVGFPYIERKLNNKAIGEGKSKVLVISQHNIGRDLSKLARDIQQRTKYQVIFKLHPNLDLDWRKKYPDLEGTQVEIEQSRNLYDIFGEVEAQIGVSSTAIYEGLAFGLPTFIFDTDSSQITENLLKFESIKAIQEFSDFETSDLGSMKAKVDRERFFKPKPAENIKQEIRIIEK